MKLVQHPLQGSTVTIRPTPHDLTPDPSAGRAAPVTSPARAAEIAAAKAAHPSNGDRALTHAPVEDGSLVTEYGLLAVVAATIAGVVIQWASGGALVSLFNALLRHARSLVGA